MRGWAVRCVCVCVPVCVGHMPAALRVTRTSNQQHTTHNAHMRSAQALAAAEELRTSLRQGLSEVVALAADK